MSNYNSTLQSNNTDLQAILDTINELPEASGGSSGGSIDTCTVTFVSNYGSYGNVYYNKCVDNVVSLCYLPDLLGQKNQLVMEDVVCNSVIFVHTSAVAMDPGVTSSPYEVSNVFTAGHVLVFGAPATPGSNTTVVFKDFD